MAVHDVAVRQSPSCVWIVGGSCRHFICLAGRLLTGLQDAVACAGHVGHPLGHRIGHTEADKPVLVGLEGDLLEARFLAEYLGDDLGHVVERQILGATASRIVLSATTGAALSLISQPDLYGDGTFATQLREAVIAWITVPQAAASAAHQPERDAEPAIASAAATLSSRLAAEDTPLTGPELALMRQWLTTLADAPSAALPAPPRRPQRSGKEGSQ